MLFQEAFFVQVLAQCEENGVKEENGGVEQRMLDLGKSFAKGGDENQRKERKRGGKRGSLLLGPLYASGCLGRPSYSFSPQQQEHVTFRRKNGCTD